MSESVWLNGALMPADEARISVFDAGLTHAAGLFETLRAYSGRVMRLRDHVNRLNASAAALHMPVSLDFDTVERAIKDLLDANALGDARLRLTVTAGAIPRPGIPVAAPPNSTVLATATPVQPYPPEFYERGMHVCISPFKQNRDDPLAGHKTLAYFSRLLAMKDAADRQCHEALWFTTDHRLAEGCICNVFLVRGGALLTPAVDTPALPGTVRKAVIELAGTESITVREDPIDIEELLAAEEVFLTGSVLEIMPVTMIEKHTVGDGAPGALTQRLRECYASLIARECR